MDFNEEIPAMQARLEALEQRVKALEKPPADEPSEKPKGKK